MSNIQFLFLKRNHALVLGMLLNIGLLMGCQTFFSEPDPTSPTASEPARLIEAPTTPRALSTAADTISLDTGPDVLTLTLWTTERFSPQADIVLTQLNSFEQARENVRVEVILKRSTGQASAMNYLQASSAVAPNILPDLVVLHTDDLPLAWEQNLIQGLDAGISPDLVDDLFPAARDLGSIDGQLAAVPLELNFDHLIYNTRVVTQVPLTWRDVLSNGLRYQFPAQAVNGGLNSTVLGHYLSAGGRFVDDQDNPVIDEVALRTLFTFYDQGLSRNLIGRDILQAATPDDIWTRYLSGEYVLSHISAHRYLNDRRLLDDTAYANIPAPAANPRVVGEAWVIAMVTRDPSRQPHALNLIDTLLEPGFNAAWAARYSVVPSRRSAFEIVQSDDPYWAFLETALDDVVAPPDSVSYEQLSRAIQFGVAEILNEDASPEDAINTVLEAADQR